ncbi:MAG: HNH endonuclease signature motif containing protein [Pseudohongiellaceae bacterium]
MRFEEWMKHRGLSASSVSKYSSALSGSISNWAKDEGVIDGPVTAIQSAKEFERVAARIRELPIFEATNKRGKNMYSSALKKYAEYLDEGFYGDIESDIEEILADEATKPTEKSDLVKARIGQGRFRHRLISYWKGCAVTSYKDASMLVASHIKPWKAASNNERLDQFNGLLLVPTLDRAFDKGFISFDPLGRIRISPLLERPELLGIHRRMGVKLRSEHVPYMMFHWEKVFHTT